MMMKTLSSVCALMLVLSFASFAESRTLTPFLFQLPENASLYYDESSLIAGGGPPEKILQRGSTVSLPMMVKSASENQIELKFHATYGEQTGIPKMPPGMNAVIKPESLVLEKGKNATITLIVDVAENAPDGWYFMNIVGVWSENDFAGTGVSLKIGTGSERPLMPSDFIPSPLKQFESGIKAEETQCKFDYLKLVIKMSNGMPACVKETSVSKLIERGWAKPV